MSSSELATTAGVEARTLPRAVALHWHRVALAAILGLAAGLNLWRLDQNGWANEYYSAAVRSMLESPRNFFFVAFDPGGLVSVDKPPLALWLQAASAKVFGYSELAILVPEALAGVAAVGVLYLLVARPFGRVAGLVAALALALSPVSVAVSRDNNPDALLALLFVLAAYTGYRAAESGRLRWLLLTAALVGLAFNTKMLAALIVVPGLVLAYLLAAPIASRTRIVHLLLAGVVLVAVSGAWIAAVELTPETSRPYVGSTDDNSALSLALDYNGLGRITGQTGGTSFAPGGGGGLGGAFSGEPGPLRLINNAMGDQGGWLLPLAIVGALSALVAALRARSRVELAGLLVVGGWFAAGTLVLSFAGGIVHTYYVSMLAPATAGLIGIGAVSLWRDARRGGLWTLLPLAALGLTVALELELLGRTPDYLSWLRPAVVVLAAVAGVSLILLAARPTRLAPRHDALAATALALGIGALLLPPAAWSKSVLDTPVNGVFPGAGPSYAGGGLGFPRPGGRGAPPRGMVGGQGGLPPGLFGGNGGPPPQGGFGAGPPGMPGGGSGDTARRALAYAKGEAEPGAVRFLLILSNEQAAAPLVIDGESVAAMGGFTGRETVLTRPYLSRLVADGDARFFLLGGRFGGPFGSTNSAFALIESVCEPVPEESWNTGGDEDGLSGGQTLYDCAGKAPAIAGG